MTGNWELVGFSYNRRNEIAGGEAGLQAGSAEELGELDCLITGIKLTPSQHKQVSENQKQAE